MPALARHNPRRTSRVEEAAHLHLITAAKCAEVGSGRSVWRTHVSRSAKGYIPDSELRQRCLSLRIQRGSGRGTVLEREEFDAYNAARARSYTQVSHAVGYQTLSTRISEHSRRAGGPEAVQGESEAWVLAACMIDTQNDENWDPGTWTEGGEV
ncbi:hypothetical protein HYPSUDRAFT_868672 [Hypholoma sublateritium FD-334 SS-4]|uniref:Uncharacterized protein n=1 Tax=Hypholoma sublateritium (strain FD-334 SS-4) TaxID=945553 RepID=A0A0D2LJA3_HYPSF|nr:hypothetical protein HYPSUDRAFT_868672 [Hypholoma sublateritium FD-334 SS-4]